jgi:hypothetical protein
MMVLHAMCVCMRHVAWQTPRGGAPEGDEGGGLEVDKKAALVGEAHVLGLAHCGVVVADPRQKAARVMSYRTAAGGCGARARISGASHIAHPWPASAITVVIDDVT